MRLTHLVLSALAILLLAAGTAAAHKTSYSEDGKIKIVWGFLGEPAVTMTKTGLDLILTDNATGAPIEGAEDTVEASLVYGDQVHAFEGFAPQHGQKGRYTDKITLTRPGIYSLRLQGTLNGTAVDLTIPAAHEVTAIEETHFPALAGPGDLQAKVTALEAKVAALEAKLQTQATTPASVNEQAPANKVPAPALPLALAFVGLAALALRRRA